jgi:hypothetical protein
MGQPKTNHHLAKTEVLQKMFPKMQTLQKQAKLKNKDSENLKNKF